MKSTEFITENQSARLKDFCKVATNFEDADFWLQRKGSIDTVGTPLKEFAPQHIGIKVVRADVLNPKFLFFKMVHTPNTGYWKQHSHGTLQLVNIKTEDVKNLVL